MAAGAAEGESSSSHARKRHKYRTHYSLADMELFEDLRLVHRGQKLNSIIEIAKLQLGSIFDRRTKYDTFKGFPRNIIQKKELNAQRLETAMAKEAWAKERKKALNGESPTLAEKETEVVDIIGDGPAQNRVVPSAAFVALAMMLYSQFLAGVPMMVAIALPLIVAYFRAHVEEYGELLHSLQTTSPLDGTMRSNGISPEKGRVYWTKRAINQFFQKTGLAYRKGTCNHGKSKTPEEVAPLRKHMGMRLLFCMVTRKA